MVMSLPSCASNMSLVDKYWKYMVGDDASYLGMYNLCCLPSANILPFNFPHNFLLLSFLHLVPPIFVISWVFPSPVPPSTSYILDGCTICKYMIPLFHHVYVYLYWVPFVRTSHPQILCACHAWFYFYFSVWWIGCNISSLQILFWDARYLSLHLPFCVFFLCYHVTWLLFLYIFL